MSLRKWGEHQVAEFTSRPAQTFYLFIYLYDSDRYLVEMFLNIAYRSHWATGEISFSPSRARGW